MSIFFGNFESWPDVLHAFSSKQFSTGAPAPDAPQPKNLLCALCDGGSYDGWAFVAWEENGKYYVVVDSHCSCMGFENWCPEEYPDKEIFIECIEREFWNDDLNPIKDALIKKLKSEDSAESK